MISLTEIETSAQNVFGETVAVRQINKATIRIESSQGIFIDIFQSLRDQKKFAFHAKLKGGVIFRLDCRPERKYRKLKTFPWHFHKGSESHVVASPFSKEKKTAIVQFLSYVKKETEV